MGDLTLLSQGLMGDPVVHTTLCAANPHGCLVCGVSQGRLLNDFPVGANVIDKHLMCCNVEEHCPVVGPNTDQ
jgi:hypothetical protein